jgi:hypothetical protein
VPRDPATVGRMAEGIELTNVQVAILEAMGRLEMRENTPADIAAEAAVVPTTITRELTGLKDRRTSLVQFGPEAGWVRTPDGDSAVLDDTLDDET